MSDNLALFARGRGELLVARRVDVHRVIGGFRAGPVAQTRETFERQHHRADHGEEDAEIEAVRKRLLAARLVEQPDGELEKLQARQRGRIERHNSYRGGEGGGRQGGAMNDLMDLNFDGDSQENLPPTIQRCAVAVIL